jgi:hypothetical protein
VKLRLFSVSVVLFVMVGLLVSSGCRREMSKTAYEKRVAGILKQVEEKMKPNLAELEKASTGGSKEVKRLEDQQVETVKNARNQLARITPPDDFFSGHSNLVEFLDLFLKLREEQTALPKSTTTASIDQRQKLQESYQMVTVAFTRASQEMSFLQNEMRGAFYDLLRYQSKSAF